MKIFHGSKYIIEAPEYGKGNLHNDYGLAFYCTGDFDLAGEWAVTDTRDGFINSYNVDLTGLSILDLRDDRFSVLNWMAILLMNRVFDINSPVARNGKDFIIKNYAISCEDYDVIIGWRADDSYFSYARSFLNNTITLETLGKAMYLGDLGIQYAFRSKKGIDSLKYERFDIAESQKYLHKRVGRDMAARKAYQEMCSTQSLESGTYLIDILRKN